MGPFEFSELLAIINKLFLIESLLQVFYYSNKKWNNTMSTKFILFYFVVKVQKGVHSNIYTVQVPALGMCSQKDGEFEGSLD